MFSTYNFPFFYHSFIASALEVRKAQCDARFKFGLQKAK
jgi:hypothetical protein